MSEEEKAIKWLEKNTKNYKLNSEELHYILVLFNLITNLKRENKKLKKQLKIKHDGFMASVDESCEYAEENQKYKEVINKMKTNLDSSINAINKKLSNNKFRIENGKAIYPINDYCVIRLKGIRTKCKELLKILNEVEYE